MYKAMKVIQSNRTHKPLHAQTVDSTTCSTGRNHHWSLQRYVLERRCQCPAYHQSTTKEETRKAVRTLKNNKSAGGDELNAEQLKCGSDVVHVFENIAELFSTITTTWDNPKKIKEGILLSLQKSGEKLRGLQVISALSSYYRCSRKCWKLVCSGEYEIR